MVKLAKKLKRSILYLKLKFLYQTRILSFINKFLIKKYKQLDFKLTETDNPFLASKSGQILTEHTPKISLNKEENIRTLNIHDSFIHSYKRFFFFRYLTKKIKIRIRVNNIFCTLSNIHKKKLLIFYSSGLSKLTISKKTLRFNNRLLVKRFINLLIKRIRKVDSFLILEIGGAIKLRKFITTQIARSLKRYQKLLIYIKSKKCFNGCRVKKKRRKKFRGFRIFK